MSKARPSSYHPKAILATLRAITRQLGGAIRVTGDGASLVRLSTDLILYRVLKLGDFGLRNRERTIRLRRGVTLTYRLNRGDIQTIREVWLDEIYRLPFALDVENVVDLGANIGLSSLYFAKVYGAKYIIAVEPNPENARLARRNLRQNGVVARVVEAAIGPFDGAVHFSDTVEPNLGFVSPQGREIAMISMASLTASEPAMASIDLLKMDIEGGEGELLSGSLDWLQAVRSIIAEFHPPIVDYRGLVRLLESRGFRWFKTGTVYRYTADAFLRRDVAGERQLDVVER